MNSRKLMKRNLCYCDPSGKFVFLVVLLIEITLTLAFFLSRDILLALCLPFSPYHCAFPEDLY